MIYETFLLILVSSQSYLKIKSIEDLISISIDYGLITFSKNQIANLISISTDYGLITFFKKSKD